MTATDRSTEPDDLEAPRVRGVREARRLADEFFAEQELLSRAPRTVAAQRADLDDYFAFCRRTRCDPIAAGAVVIARYVSDLSARPPSGVGRPRVGAGLAVATVRRRLSSVRSWYAHLVFEGVRARNPVRAAGRAGGDDKRRALVSEAARVPWIPTRDEWTRIIRAAAKHGLRTLAMLLTQYDGALRRAELVRLTIADVLPLADEAVRVPRVKGGPRRTVRVSAATGEVLARYLDVRFAAAKSPDDPLFVSEGPRNRGGRLSESLWSSVVRDLQRETKLDGLATHTMRHLRLTDLAGADWTLEELAEYAGHKRVDTTRIYLHMRDTRLRTKYARTSATIDAWVQRVVGPLVAGVAAPADAAPPTHGASAKESR